MSALLIEIMCKVNPLKYAVILLILQSITSAAFNLGCGRSLKSRFTTPSSEKIFHRSGEFDSISSPQSKCSWTTSNVRSSTLSTLDIQKNLISIFHRMKACLYPVRMRILVWCFTFAVIFSHAGIAGAAPSSGRVGGSFKSSPRPSISSPRRSSATWNHSRQPYGGVHRNSLVTVYVTSGWHQGSNVAVVAPRRMTIPEMTVLLTLAGVMIQGFVKNNERVANAGPLGAGATAISVTVAMNVPDRDDPSSILKRIRKLALATDTTNRKGLQDLISEVSLELLRQEKSIISASTKAKHFHNPELAEKQFRSESIQMRSKFDHEVVNKFGNKKLVDETQMNGWSESSVPTKAVISINMAIEGNSLASVRINSRSDLVKTLSQIATDSQVDACLMSGEVMWSPEIPGERITNEDLCTDFPNLIPL